MSRPKAIRLLQIAIIFLLLLAILTAAIRNFTQGNAFGNDYYIFYLAGQAAITGDNPYSDQVAHQVQMGLLKRPALPEEDQLAFAYPLFALAVVLPTLWLPYDWAQSLWMAVNLIALAASLLFLLTSLRKSQKINPGWLILAISPLSLYPMFYGMLMGNFVLLITAFLLFLLSSCIASQHLNAFQQIFFGICLAWCSIKPQFVWLFYIFIFLYILRKHLWILLGSSAASLFLMSGISFVAGPNWVSQWIHRMNQYSQYNQALPNLLSWLNQLVNSQYAFFIGLAIIIPALRLTGIFFWRWWRHRLNWILMLAWCGFITYLLHPRAVSYEQYVFIFPFIVWLFSDIRKGAIATLASLAAIILSWVAFFVTGPYHPLAVDLLPYLFYLLWLGWLFFSKRMIRNTN